MDVAVLSAVRSSQPSHASATEIHMIQWMVPLKHDVSATEMHMIQWMDGWMVGLPLSS